MSLATLKKKTLSKYNNNSVNKQFSINGTHRSQGYIGQTSLSRTLINTPKVGLVSKGHGSCCGYYPETNIINSSTCSTENSTVIKPSVLSSKGMLARRNRWAKRPAPYSSTKPSDSINQSSSGDYIVYRRKIAIEESNGNYIRKKAEAAIEAGKTCNMEDTLSDKCCRKHIVMPEEEVVAMSQGEYIFKRIAECTDFDISYINYNTNTGTPFATCGNL